MPACREYPVLGTEHGASRRHSHHSHTLSLPVVGRVAGRVESLLERPSGSGETKGGRQVSGDVLAVLVGWCADVDTLADTRALTAGDTRCHALCPSPHGGWRFRPGGRNGTMRCGEEIMRIRCGRVIQILGEDLICHLWFSRGDFPHWS